MFICYKMQKLSDGKKSPLRSSRGISYTSYKQKKGFNSGSCCSEGCDSSQVSSSSRYNDTTSESVESVVRTVRVDSQSSYASTFSGFSGEIFVEPIRRRKKSVEPPKTVQYFTEQREPQPIKKSFSALKSDTTNSLESLNRSSGNFFLKKTDEIMNFSNNVFDDTGTSSDGRSVARMKLPVESQGPVEKSYSHSSKMKLQKLKAGDVKFSKENELLKLSAQRFSKTLRGLEAVINATSDFTGEDERNICSDLFSNKYTINKNQLVNFLLEKYQNVHNVTAFTKTNVKLTSEDKPKFIEQRVTEPEAPVQEDRQIKRFFRDMCFYIIFLIFITVVALSMVSVNMFYFADMTRIIFFETPNPPSLDIFQKRNTSNTTFDFPEKSLADSTTFGDFWAFAENTMINMFYWDFFNTYINPADHTKGEDRKMFFENQILGVPRIRQVRVRNDSCLVHSDVQRFFKNCYYYYSIFGEETRPIIFGMQNSATASAWEYTEASELGTSYYWGVMSIYGGGGYYLDFDLEREKMLSMIHELKENFWVSRATRAIFIDFNLYNANINLFCICKIILEFPPAGGMIPRADFQTLKLIRYLNSSDFFILACEFVLVVFIGYFTYECIRLMRIQGSLFFYYWWNYIELVILTLCYLYIILGVVLYIQVNALVSTLKDRVYKYTEFGTVKFLQMAFNNVIALILFLCWIKLFKFLNINVIMVEFKRTLSKSFKDVLGFFPMFITMFGAFALLAYLLFGHKVKDYSSLDASFFALLQAFVGEFEYHQIQEANPILGPIFYVCLIFFVFFVLLNMFIAIINDAYSSVKSELISGKPRTGTYFRRGFLNIVGCSCCGLDKKLENKKRMRKRKVFEQIKRSLRNAGFSDIEIKIFFAKYDIDIHNAFDENTKRKIIEDLELKQIDFSETSEQFQVRTLKAKFDNLNERMEEMEGSIQPIIDKVDILLRRL